VSLVGYRAKNHPQQVGKRGARPEIDDRATTPEVFDPLNERFHFTLDVAASAQNAKCARYYTIREDGLKQSWAGERVWCNPPYSSIEPWLEKAWAEWDNNVNEGVELIVMLLPANRTEQGWWQRQVEPTLRGPARVWGQPQRRPRGDFRVEFLPGRLRFLSPGALEIKPNERPPYGCCLLIWGYPQVPR
jgi:hypothetical protein